MTGRGAATRVVILGGGFAGISTARELSRLSAAGDAPALEIVLVNRENYFVFQPLLPDIIPGTIEATHAVVPLRRMLPRVDVEVGVVRAIDTEKRRVEVMRRTTGDTVEMAYDHLVLALGSVTDFRAVPGMAEHAIGMRTLGDAFYLRNRALDMLEEADLEPDEGRRAELLTFVVVGGGSTGVEVAAELHDLVEHAARTFERLGPAPRVVLVHSRNRLLPEYGERLGRYATRKARKRGIDVRLGVRLSEVHPSGVVLSDGTRIAASTVVSTVGNAPHPVLGTLPSGSVEDGGWVRTTPELGVPGLPGVWAAGDCATIGDVVHGGPVPATAQHAVREGPHLARNIVATLRGEPTTPFHYDQQGMLVSLGRRRAVGVVRGVKTSGFVAWLMWRGYYLSQLPTLDRRLRVAADWVLDTFLPRDIVQIHLRRGPTRPDLDGGVTGGIDALELTVDDVAASPTPR